jgi:hypothetical protein
MARPKFRITTRTMQARVQQLLARNEDKIKEAMTDAGHFLRGEVQLRTPFKEGFLTSDVTFAVIPYKHSHATVLYIPSNAPSAPYAVRMHEATYNLGPGSRAKQEKVPVKVGREYLTRAIDDNREEIVKAIVDKLKL